MFSNIKEPVRPRQTELVSKTPLIRLCTSLGVPFFYYRGWLSSLLTSGRLSGHSVEPSLRRPPSRTSTDVGLDYGTNVGTLPKSLWTDSVLT